MRVENLVHWSFQDFDYIPGQEIDLPDHIAKARIAAGLCKLVKDGNNKVTHNG